MRGEGSGERRRLEERGEGGDKGGGEGRGGEGKRWEGQ